MSTCLSHEAVVLMSNSRIKLSHDLKELAEKQESILVMKDKSVLDEGSDDEAVEMEEVHLADQEKHDTAKRKAKHGKKFNPYEDDWDGAEEGILSKYDNFDDLESRRRSQRTRELVVGQTLSSRPTSSEVGNQYIPSDEFPTTLTMGSSRPSAVRHVAPPVSVEEQLRFQSDFYTSSEAANLNKFIPKKKHKKRKQEEEDDDMPVKKFEAIVIPEEDEELYAQLSRMRRIEKIQIRDDEYIANVIRENRDADFQNSEIPVASAVTDFVSRIQVPLEEVEETPVGELMEEDQPESIAAEPVTETKEQPRQELSRESAFSDVKVDSGLACALAFFQSRGAVDKDRGSQEVRIEHRDEFGRILDAKEAYKQLSWKFHGVKPGAAKQEKRLRKIENEIKSSKSSH